MDKSKTLVLSKETIEMLNYLKDLPKNWKKIDRYLRFRKSTLTK